MGYGCWKKNTKQGAGEFDADAAKHARIVAYDA